MAHCQFYAVPTADVGHEETTRCDVAEGVPGIGGVVGGRDLLAARLGDRE